MCVDCTMKQIGEERAIEVTPRMRTLIELVQEWYEVDGHGAGGILHVVLDDHNLEDDSLDISEYVDFTKVDPNLAYEAGLILGYLRSMTLPERAVAVSLAHGEALPEGVVAGV